MKYVQVDSNTSDSFDKRVQVNEFPSGVDSYWTHSTPEIEKCEIVPLRPAPSIVIGTTVGAGAKLDRCGHDSERIQSVDVAGVGTIVPTSAAGISTPEVSYFIDSQGVMNENM